MGAANGWERPNWFSDKAVDVAAATFRRANWFGRVAGEVAATTHRVALADLSVFFKFEVSGPDTGAFLYKLGANISPRVGRIGLIHSLTPAGGVAAEFTVTLETDTRAYLTSAAAAEEIDHDLLRGHAIGFDVLVSNRTEDIAVIGMMGPRAPDVLKSLTQIEPTDFGWLTARSLVIACVDVLALRVSYVGEAGFEFHVAADKAVQVFTTIETAAQPFGLGYYGAYAANSMRFEKGFRAWGADLTSERIPIEAGLGRFVKTEGRDFMGRDALLARNDPWDMVLLDIEAGDVDPFYSHTVWQAARPVGIVTSGVYGHRTGKTLGLAYLRDPNARDCLSVSILGRHRSAVILDDAPYDPDNTRMKTR